MAMNIKYKKDQWSPINTQGAKRYDRDFLIMLQNIPASKRKPMNLPDLEIILQDEAAINQVKPRKVTSKRSLPAFIKTNRNDNASLPYSVIEDNDLRNIRIPTEDCNKTGEEALNIREDSLVAREKLVKVRETNVLKREEIVTEREEHLRYRQEEILEREKSIELRGKLLKSLEESLKVRENAFNLSEGSAIKQEKYKFIPDEIEEVPESKNAREDIDGKDEMYKTMRNILDNLTMENIDQSLQQINLLDIATQEQLMTLLNIIFEKAITDHNSEKYAHICKHLSFIKVPVNKKEHNSQEVFINSDPTNVHQETETVYLLNQESINIHQNSETVREINEEPSNLQQGNENISEQNREYNNLQQLSESACHKNDESIELQQESVTEYDDVELHCSEDPWKPYKLVASTSTSDNERICDETCRIVRQVLNKLTALNFDASVIQVKSLNINLECLQRLVYLVYERSIAEPFSPLMYAHFCHQLSDIQVPDNKEMNFKTLLIAECQFGIEKMLLELNRRKNIVEEIRESFYPEQKLVLQLKLDKFDNEIRIKSMKFVKFIGGLFRNNILSKNTIMNYITALLENNEEMSLECLCILLVLAGKELEMVKGQNLQNFFKKIEGIINDENNEIGNRIKYMLEDLIKLRNADSEEWINDLDPTILKRIFKVEQKPETSISQKYNLSPEPPIALYDVKDHEYYSKIKQKIDNNSWKLCTEICEETKTKDQLVILVALIFETAINNSTLTNALLSTCKTLCYLEGKHEDRIKGFKILLMDKVRKEFESGGQNHINLLKITEFKGKLYNSGILPSAIIWKCIQKCLSLQDDNSLECLCVLLAITGRKLESDLPLQKLFGRMQNIVDENCDDKISPRIRCKLQDVINLRKPKWAGQTTNKKSVINKVIQRNL